MRVFDFFLQSLTVRRRQEMYHGVVRKTKRCMRNGMVSVTDSGITVIQWLSIFMSGTLDLLFKLSKFFGERSVVEIS